jgi:hypothetical protein
MMLRAPDTEALYEGIAQKGFGVPSLALDGSPVPLDSTALQRSLLGHIAREVEWGSPNATGSKPCGSKAKQPKTN